MKKTYQSPEALIIEIQIRKNLLFATSETKVLGDNGGWVKELAGEDDDWTLTDTNLWDDEW